LWVIPGRNGSCNAISERGFFQSAGCGGNASLVERGIEGYRQSGSQWQITGLVPDGSHVTLRLASGASIPAPVNADNAYVVVRPVTDPVVKTTISGPHATITTISPRG